MAAFSNMCSRQLLQVLTARTYFHTSYFPFQPILIRSICKQSNPAIFQLLKVTNKSKTFVDSAQICLVGPLACQGRHFSSKSAGTKSSLTDDILKSKVGAQEEKTGTSQTQDTSSDDKDEKNKDSWFSGKNAWKLGLLSLAGMGILMSGNLLYIWGQPMHDKEGNEIPDEFTILPKWKAYPKRAMKELHFFKQMIQEPSSHQLLPDPLKEPYYQPPYTLVLEMTDVLVHPDWTLSTGWRFKKRPGIEYFLQQVGPPLFEVVIYTREQGFTAFPIIDGIDPNGAISFRLFRDATRYMNGHHVKDLSCLNRDLDKVIIVDCDHRSFQLQPNNAVFLKKWKGNDDDRTLVELAHFLQTIANSGVENVRPVLEYYSQFDDPLEVFKENQIKLKEEQERSAAQAAEAAKQKSLAGSWSMGLYGRRKGS